MPMRHILNECCDMLIINYTTWNRLFQASCKTSGEEEFRQQIVRALPEDSNIPRNESKEFRKSRWTHIYKFKIQ